MLMLMLATAFVLGFSTGWLTGFKRGVFRGKVVQTLDDMEFIRLKIISEKEQPDQI